MQRRTFLQTVVGIALSHHHSTTPRVDLDKAAAALGEAASGGRIDAATLYVRHGDDIYTRSFGNARSEDAVFLIASISKPMAMTALMTLYDRGEFRLDDPAARFLPEFKGESREQITVRQLLTHTSGLPDQLPQNRDLRAANAELSEFVSGAMRTPLLFAPGARYRYSSMGILLAAEIGRRISGVAIPEFVNKTVFHALGMKRSALGLGQMKQEDTMRCQVEAAAPESGAGDPSARNWDWNSEFWRNLGAPWGGVHASARDVATFLDDFLRPSGRVIKPTTARLMLENHNADGTRPHGLGFSIGAVVGGPGCSEKTFGHTGATGTLAWADPASDTSCVVLTTLPSTVLQKHPRRTVSELVARAVQPG